MGTIKDAAPCGEDDVSSEGNLETPLEVEYEKALALEGASSGNKRRKSQKKLEKLNAASENRG